MQIGVEPRCVGVEPRFVGVRATYVHTCSCGGHHTMMVAPTPTLLRLLVAVAGWGLLPVGRQMRGRRAFVLHIRGLDPQG